MSPNDILYDINPEALRRIARNRRGFWAASLLTAMAIIAAGVAAGEGWLPWPQELSKMLGLGLAAAPGVVWLGLLALLVRDDEGTRRVATILWLITGALYLVTVYPLLTHLFQVDAWLSLAWWTDVLADLLIIGPLEMLLLYLILRYGVYPGETLHRLVDGPLFGVAAALGMAAVVSAIRIWPRPAIPPTEVWIVGERALTYAVLGGWLGYALARSRFTRPPGYYLPGMFLLTVLLHALFDAILRGANALAFAFSFFAALAVAAILGLMGFLLLAWRVHRQNQAILRMAARIEIIQERERPPSLLGDIVEMVGTQETEATHTPPPPPPAPAPDRDEDELASLKRSWEALIADQEGGQ